MLFIVQCRYLVSELSSLGLQKVEVKELRHVHKLLFYIPNIFATQCHGCLILLDE